MVGWEWLLFTLGIGVGAMWWAWLDKSRMQKALRKIKKQEEDPDILNTEEEVRILKERQDY